MSARFDHACKEACDLLDTLNKPAQHGHSPLAVIQHTAAVSPALLARCDGVLFTFTTKAGLVVGLERGHGFFIRRLAGGLWSAPCFLRITAAQAGAIVGIEMISTVGLSMNTALAEQLEAGAHPEVGADISIQLGKTRHGDEDIYDLPADDTDLISYSVAKGAILDASLRGGRMTVDEHSNAECYGAVTTAHTILSGKVPPPPQMAPLYQRLKEASEVP